jgi:DNA-binding CsgD family transcriptional regulator
MSKSDKLYQSVEKHSRITKDIKIQESDIDYALAEKHIPMFEMLDSLQTGIIIVIDYYKHNYYFSSKKFDSHFGFHENNIAKTDQHWFRNRLHPDDYIVNIAGIEGRKYIEKQPIEKRKQYKLIEDFRLKNDKGEWIRLTMQDHILELDKKGNPWLNLKILDFSPDQNIQIPARVTFKNKVTGEVIFTNQDYETNNISNREREVLDLISKGMRSKEISEELHISINTVSNHRRNIIDKLKVSNTQEAVSHAKELGII